MSTLTELTKQMAIQSIASGIEEPEEVAKRLGAPLGLIHNWCSTRGFRFMAKRYGQKFPEFQFDPQFEFFEPLEPEPEPEPELKPRMTSRSRSRSRTGRKRKARSKPKVKPRLKWASTFEPKSQPKPQLESKPQPKRRRHAGDPRRKIQYEPCWKRVLVIAQVAAGASKSAMHREHGVDRRTVDRWCEAADVKSRFKQGRSSDIGEKKARAVVLVKNEGLSYDAAGAREGIEGETVRVECLRLGIVSRFAQQKTRGRGKMASHPQRERLVKMVHEEGLTIAHVARTEGVPESTLRGWCKKDKVSSPLAWKRSRKKS